MAEKTEKGSLFARLTKLFRSGPVVRRRVKDFRQAGSSSSLEVFRKAHSDVYNSTLSAYGAFDRMCISCDTLIPVPGKDRFLSLSQLIEKYPNGEKFIVYAYDNDKKQLIPAWAHHPRSSGIKDTVKVTFDDGSSLICTPDHPCMLRNGEYMDAGDLQQGMSMMPFYRKCFNGKKKDDGNFEGYENIYTMSASGHRGWQSEHRLIADWAYPDANMKDVVHHIDHVPFNNEPSNLVFMSTADHTEWHRKHAHEMSNETREKLSRMQKEKWINNDARRQALVEFNKSDDIRKKRSAAVQKFNHMNQPAAIEKRKGKYVIRQTSEYRSMLAEKQAKYRQEKNEKAWEKIDRNSLIDALTAPGSKRITKIANILNVTSYTVLQAAKLQFNVATWEEAINVATALKTNHKVVSVIPHGFCEVGDLTVDGYENFATSSIICHNSRYSDFSEMEATPEIAAGLDVYSEEACSADDKGQVLHVYSENAKIKEILDELFFDILNVDFNLTMWVRNLVKYGDFFLFTDISPEFGIINVYPIPISEIEREEGFNADDPSAVRFRWITRGNQTLENWQVAHFRLLGNDAFLPYGSSVLEAARRIWRQLIMMEDAMLVYRVIRAPERRVFYIDVGATPPEDISNYVEQAQTSLKRNQIVDKNNGKVDQRYNPLCIVLKSLIKLQDGRNITLEELIKEREAGKTDQWAYSIDHATQSIVPGKITWAGVTQKDASIMRVTLDDGTWRDCTPEHRIMLRNGEYRKASELKVGDALMPLYTELSSIEDGHRIVGYEKTYNPFTQRYGFTHRNNVCAMKGFDEIKGKVVHHVDFNKRNNSPENLMAMTWKEHHTLHGQVVIAYNKSKIGRANSKRRLEKTRSEGKLPQKLYVELWKNADIRKKRVDALTLQIDDEFLIHCYRVMSNINKGLSTKEADFIHALSNDALFEKYIVEKNENFRNGEIVKQNRSSLQMRFKRLGFKKGFESFKQSWLIKSYDINDIKNFAKSRTKCKRNDVLSYFGLSRYDFETLLKLTGHDVQQFRKEFFAERKQRYMNHKVAKIEMLPHREDTGCITVESFHNFAVGPANDTITEECNSWIFIHNSVDEDYFLPVRGGESGTKIETLAGGQNTAAIEDVQYIQKKLFAALKIPKAYLGYDEDTGCITGNTLVPLLDGTCATVEELATSFANGQKEAWVYSCDPSTGATVPGRAVNAWKTKEVDRLVNVTLDTGGTLQATTNHRFMLRDGTYKRADELVAGDSLMPLYKRDSVSKKRSGEDLLQGYEMVLDNASSSWKYTHKLVNEAMCDGNHQVQKTRVIHHKNFNKRDNTPDNLQEMTWSDHRKLHSQCLESTLLRPDVVLKREPNRIAALKADKHRAIKSEQMRRETTTPGAGLYEWIHGDEISEKMSQVMHKNWENQDYRQLKTEQSRNNWKDPSYREKYTGDNHWTRKSRTEYTIDWLRDFCVEHHVTSVNQFKKGYRDSVHGISPVGIRFVCRLLREASFDSWKDFEKTILFNHKVAAVETVKLGTPVAVYDIEVEKWSNFAACSNTGSNILSENCVYLHNSKATLAQEDIRFSRAISRIQKTIIAELNKLAQIHLYCHGFEDDDLKDFVINLTNPSSIAQQQKLELIKTKFEIAGQAPEGVVDRKWIRKTVLGLTNEEIEAIKQGRKDDKQEDADIEAAAAPAGGEGGGEEGGGETTAAGDEALFAGEKKPGQLLTALPARGEPKGDGFLDEFEEDDEIPGVELSIDDEDAPIKAQKKMMNVFGGPIKPSRKVSNGPGSTHMPDFHKMTSVGGAARNQDSMNKPYGDILSSFREQKEENTPAQLPRLTREMQKMLGSLGDIIGTKRKALLSEDLHAEIDLTVDNDEN